MVDIKNTLGGGPIILFDAQCVLCSANAQFILKHDKKQRYRLASMQGEVGAALFLDNGMDPNDPNSILVIDNSLVRKDSDAVLSIYEGLGWPWHILTIFRIVPTLLRDPVYRWVAAHRYRLFGKRSTCWIPSAEHLDRIL
jgi:predicted DCC family thiol-disulfide oxidoreductase YuxK